MKALYDQNFWEVNSDYLLISEFKNLYDSDKSKNKTNSSKILWAIYFAYNPEYRDN